MASMRLFDTHTHLTDEKFDADRDALIASLPENGVDLVLDCALDLANCAHVRAIAEQYPFVYAAYGVHPHEAGNLKDDDLAALEAYLSTDRCVALGEIGLDYHYDFAPREVQRRVFAQQLELAVAANKPVVLHDREAHADMLAMLKPHRGKLRGVMHCYSGSAEMTRDFLDLGLYLGFGGSVTFANAQKTVLAAQATPLSRILLETDCPYLTPVPFRGKRNDPTYTRYPCKRIAQLHQIEPNELAAIALQNGKELFSIH